MICYIIVYNFLLNIVLELFIGRLCLGLLLLEFVCHYFCPHRSAKPVFKIIVFYNNTFTISFALFYKKNIVLEFMQEVIIGNIFSNTDRRNIIKFIFFKYRLI